MFTSKILKHARLSRPAGYFSVIQQASFSEKSEPEEPAQRQWRVPWAETSKMYQSSLKALEPFNPFTPDMLRKMQTPVDLRPSTVRKWYIRKQEEMLISEQQFVEERFSILGADLAAAHFIVARGGSVKLFGEKEWISKQTGGVMPSLPDKYVPGLYIEAINCKDMILYYEGLANLEALKQLKWISFEGLECVDEWFIDKISSMFGSNLEYLDISHCNNVTYRCFSCFYRFQNLKVLKAEGISDSPEFQLSCMMLEDMIPGLKIEGVMYNKSIGDSPT